MSSASANSSVKTSKEVEKNVEETKIDIRVRVVGGPFSMEYNEKEQSYTLEMKPEYSIDYTVDMVDLVKSVCNYSIRTDAEGNIVREDPKTGYRFISKGKSYDVTIEKPTKTRTLRNEEK